ncbi:MAG: AAA family ATPase [Myxococcota bacterium]
MKAADFLWSYRCNLQGCCCSGWRVGFREHDWHRMKRAAVGTALEEDLDEALSIRRPATTPFASLIPPRAHVGRFDQDFGEMAKGEDGACRFLAEDKACRVHAEIGEAAMPQICRNFPIAGLETPDGVETFWEMVCPEVAAALARSESPARIVEAPESFDRPVIAFRPNAGAPPVRLTWERDVPFETVAGLRRDAAEVLADHADRPLWPLARLLWHVHGWAMRPDAERPDWDGGLSGGAYVTSLLQVAAAFRETADSPKWIRARIAHVRRFFRHHPWGTERTLDVLEAGSLPTASRAAEALAGAGPNEHLVLANYLVARSQAVPLHNNGALYPAWLGLVESVGTALYLAGTFALAGEGPLGKGPMAAALALSEWMYRGRKTAPPPFATQRRLGALDLGDPPGTLRDLPSAVEGLARRRGAPLRLDDAGEAVDALSEALKPRLEVALQAHALGVKTALAGPLDDLARRSADPWSESPPPEVAPLVEKARRAEARLLDRMAVSEEDVPLVALARRLRLSDAEIALVGVLLLSDTDRAWSRALVHVGLDYGHRLPSSRTLAVLLGDGAAAALREDGPLRHLEIVRDATPAGASPGDGDRRWALAPRVQAFLLGAPGEALPADLAPLAVSEGRAAQRVPPPREVVEETRRATLAAAEQVGAVVLVGPDGHDRHAVVRLATDRGVLGLRAPARLDSRTLRRAAREAVLSDRSLLLLAEPKTLEADDLAEALAGIAERTGRPVFVATHEPPAALYGRVPLASVRVPAPTWEERLRLLARGLPSDVILSDPDGLRSAVRSLAVPPDQLLAATRQASAEALLAARRAEEDDEPGDGRPRLSVARLMGAMREQMTSRIGEFAHLVAVSQGWEDLQLPEADKDRLRELVTAHRHRHRVLDDWGFGTTTSGTGLTSLFHGPPGTGKTMAAGIVARELGLEVFRVDLSRVVDKYIGETEKSLARVFDEAEQGEVLLLFDEADSLFGKRTAVSSSTDRYANLGVNYLLQRIERYRGVVVLTTNHASQMDDAFKRRIRYQVHFPMPAMDERVRIWQSLLPAEAPVALDDVDWEWLGEDYELSGGHIRNAVLTAATLAAIRGDAIAMDDLVEGANREYRSLGRVVRD